MITEALCNTCGQFSNRYADLGAEGYECELCYEGEICTEPLPANIELYSTRFTGEGRAKCTDCNFISAYWECACELIHDCNEFNN